MRVLGLILSLCFVLTGCEKGKDTKTSQKGKTASTDKAKSAKKDSTTNSPTKALYQISPIKWVDNGKVGLSIAADGTFKGPNGQTLGKFTADGKMLDKKGNVKLTLKSDGTIVDPKGKALPGKIDDKDVYTLNGKSLTIGDDGTLKGPTPGDGTKLEGITKDNKRLAVYATVLMFTPTASGNSTASEAKGPKAVELKAEEKTEAPAAKPAEKKEAGK